MLAIALFSLGAASPTAMAPAAGVGSSAIAVIVPAAGSQVRGIIHFTQERNGVHVVGEITGLAPGSHGMHVHEKGDISAPDLSSAGGHYNPDGEMHGGPMAMERHEGDLGNIQAGPDGRATLDVVDSHLQLAGSHSIIGRAVIIHHDEDDMTGASGNAGSRVAGGVIGIVELK